MSNPIPGLKAGKFIQLEAGVYDFDEPDPFTANIVGVDPSRVILRMWQPWQPTYYTRVTDVQFQVQGEYPALILDRGSATVLVNPIFSHSLEHPDHTQLKRGAEFERHGLGMEVRYATDIGRYEADNSYHLRIINPAFEFLEYGVLLQKPILKGTARWLIEDGQFNGCREAISGDNFSECDVVRGLIQLSQRGIYIKEGNFNEINRTKFERNILDFEVTAESYDNCFWHTNPQRWIDNGVRTTPKGIKQGSIKRFVSARNIDRPPDLTAV